MSQALTSGYGAFEEWELKLVKEIASTFRTDTDELHAELLKRLLELKARGLKVRNWRSFLAKSLYNAARDFLRRQRVRDRYFSPLEVQLAGDSEVILSLEDILASPETSPDLHIDLETTLSSLSPELKELWGLLLEEAGNTSSVAKRLGKPRKTVEYWILKIKSLLRQAKFDE